MWDNILNNAELFTTMNIITHGSLENVQWLCWNEQIGN